jgi:putative endonuclease
MGSASIEETARCCPAGSRPKAGVDPPRPLLARRARATPLISTLGVLRRGGLTAHYAPMFHIYILCGESTGRFYIGSTGDLRPRIDEHNAGLATATKDRGPWCLVHSEEYATRSLAVRRERYVKTGTGRRELRHLLEGGTPKGG